MIVLNKKELRELWDILEAAERPPYGVKFICPSCKEVYKNDDYCSCDDGDWNDW